MPVLENVVETKIHEYAEANGCLSLKLNVMGRRGWPDRLFIAPGPHVLFMEVKRLGEKPRKLQEYIHNVLRKFGCSVELVDNERDGCAAIDRIAAKNQNL